MRNVSRRKFLQGCCAGIAAMNGSQLTNVVFAQDDSSNPRDIIVVVFLRGGMDSMSFLAPYQDSNYHVARERLALGSEHVIDLDGQFGLHPSAALLKEFIDQGHLGMVMACGSPNGSRSHFEAQDYMEYGTPGDRYYAGGGWLARHLAAWPSDSIFQAVSTSSTLDTALEGLPGALAVTDAGGLSLQGSSSQQDDMRRALREMYMEDNELRDVAQGTLDAIDIVDRANPDDYTPPGGVEYPSSSLSDSLASVAQMIRLNLGLQAATINYGGWDTHGSQASYSNPASGYFADRVATLSEALHAFWSDLSDYHGRVSLVVMTEFGRRLRENDNTGTDHGRGGLMMVLSSNLTRGGIFGAWPGLAEEQLVERVDLQVTTDFRTVLGELVLARGGNADLAEIFPGFDYPGSLGLFPSQAGVQQDTLDGFLKNYS